MIVLSLVLWLVPIAWPGDAGVNPRALRRARRVGDVSAADPAIRFDPDAFLHSVRDCLLAGKEVVS